MRKGLGYLSTREQCPFAYKTQSINRINNKAQNEAAVVLLDLAKQRQKMSGQIQLNTLHVCWVDNFHFI